MDIKRAKIKVGFAIDGEIIKKRDDEKKIFRSPWITVYRKRK